ncbi:MAG: DNA recombination protein RmuC [Clostridia bacterium]|nr:DNA recombination protein RmuC [Clostridia bacterium]
MEIYLYIIIALLAVNAAILLVLLLRKPKKDTEVTSSLAVNSEKLTQLGVSINDEFERSRRELNTQQSDMRTENVQALEKMNEKIAAIAKDNAQYQAKLTAALNESLNSIRLNNIEQNEKLGRAVAEAVDRMRESNEKKLEQMRLTVDEKLASTLTERLDSSFKTVSDQLENVYKSLGEMKELSGGVTANVTALNRVLTNVKARGTWAEIQLGSILDQTIPGMYETNFACTKGSAERVEFAVRIPSADGSITYLPVDSKFPMEDYVRVCTAADNADAVALEAARKALEDRVLSEAKAVAKYINVPVTTPYAILYLATDALFAEVVSSKRGLVEKIQNELNVMIAGPTTVTAMLNSLSMGFRAVAINEKANEVRLLLGAAKAQYTKFGLLIEKARKKIDEAGKSLDEAQKRNDIINKKLKNVETPDMANELLGIEDKTEADSDE